MGSKPILDGGRATIDRVISASAILASVSEESRAELAAASRIAQASKGEVIWMSGGQVDFFGLVGTGFVKMVRVSADGTDVALEIMGPGQIFGMMGAVEGSGCPLSAVAVTPVGYLRIPKEAFLPIYRQSDSLKDTLIRRSAVRLHHANDLMARMSRGKVEERIAAILLLLAESYGRRSAGQLDIGVPLTRQDISEMAGTTVESAIRTLSRWQKEGVIRTRHKLISILNEEALSESLRA